MGATPNFWKSIICYSYATLHISWRVAILKTIPKLEINILLTRRS